MIVTQGNRAIAGRVPLRTDLVALAKSVGWEYFPIAFVGRLPFAMMIVGILTLIATVRGSVAEAGIAAACAGIATAALGPTIGSLADRLGEKSVLLVVCAVNVAMVTLFLCLVFAAAPFAVIAIVAGLTGGTTPQVAPFSRSRLAGLASRPATQERRDRAVSSVMSYESVMDEASFVIGPVIVGVLTSLIAPWVPLAFGAALTAVIVVSFALHHSGRRVLVERGHAPTDAGSAWSGRILLLAVAMILVGAIFGSILTALTEFMSARGNGEQTGIIYGAMSVGAIVIAGVVAAFPSRFTLPARWTSFAAVSMVGAVALAGAETEVGVAFALFLSGCGVGAVLVTLFSLGAREAPAGRSVTVLTTLQSSLVVGQAAAAAVGGFVAQELGSSVAFGVTAAIAVALTGVAVLYTALFRPPSLLLDAVSRT